MQYLHANYLNSKWTWDPTLQCLHSKTKTHIQLGTQPCNICISILKRTLDMGSNLAIFASQIKTHIGLGFQPNVIFTLQTKTHSKHGTQPNAILTFQTKTHIRLGTHSYNTHIYD